MLLANCSMSARVCVFLLWLWCICVCVGGGGVQRGLIVMPFWLYPYAMKCKFPYSSNSIASNSSYFSGRGSSPHPTGPGIQAFASVHGLCPWGHGQLVQILILIAQDTCVCWPLAGEMHYQLIYWHVCVHFCFCCWTCQVWLWFPLLNFLL